MGIVRFTFQAKREICDVNLNLSKGYRFYIKFVNQIIYFFKEFLIN